MAITQKREPRLRTARLHRVRPRVATIRLAGPARNSCCVLYTQQQPQGEGHCAYARLWASQRRELRRWANRGPMQPDGPQGFHPQGLRDSQCAAPCYGDDVRPGYEGHCQREGAEWYGCKCVSVCLYASVMEVIDILFHIHCASRVHALATHLPRQMHQVGGYSVLSFGSLLASSSGLRIFIFVSPAHPRGCKRLREPPLPSPPPPVKWQAPLQGSSLLTEFVQACANCGAWCTRSFLSCVCWRCSA